MKSDGFYKIEKKLLLVTFPVDLGNETYETRLINIFKNCPDLDLKVHRFTSVLKKGQPKKKLSVYYFLIILKRIFCSVRLCEEIRRAKKEGRKILFHGVSPAFFAYPLQSAGSSYIVTDWTKKLYDPLYYPRHNSSPLLITCIHKKILNSQKYVFCLTDAVLEEIARDYEVPKDKLKKTKVPFSYDLDIFSPSPDRKDKEVRILFVGGDFQRKGGDALLKWFVKNNDENLRLTIVTKDLPDLVHPRLKVEINVNQGSQRHVELFNENDIFVLPTTVDGYPVVLGEAACAGLTVLTTKNALGAPEVIKEGVNGHICGSQEELFDKLDILIKDKKRIESMKRKSRELMEKEFNREKVLNEYLDFVFKK